MKAGDLVEFKAGLFGIQAPANLGIYIERVREKGTYFAVLHTVKGRQKIKPDNLTSRRLTARIAPDEMEGDLGPRLKQLIEEVAKGKVETERKLGEANDRDLWQKAKDADGAPMSPEDLAGAFFDTKTPTRGQAGEIRKLLETCREPGVGYFERAPGREELWIPITRAQHSAFHKESDGLKRLRNKLVEVYEEEQEEGPPRTMYRGRDVADAGLDEEDTRRLAFVGEAMRDFVLYDRFRGQATLGASGKHTLDSFSLFPYLKWLALDWTGAERVTTSSTFIEFLVDTDLLGLDDAVTLVARRKVLAFPSFGWEMPADVVRAAERASPDIPDSVIAARRDLREQRCFTIDPPDARDHDDAVGMTENADGTTDLWVHIADVSHFVEKDSTLDHEAKKRATSVYLPTGVLPMLPPRLSNDLCSLEPQKDRLAMTARIRVAPDGHIVEEEAMESIIRVTANVPYGDVLAALESGDPEYIVEAPIAGGETQRVPARDFMALRALADRLDKHRRGLVIETSERRVKLTADNVEHVEKMGNRATRLIETFMVTANEAVARILTKEKLPTLYRCHPLPDRTSVERFNAQCKTMEVPISIDLPDPPNKPKDDEEGESILDQLKKGKAQMFGGGMFSIKGMEPEPEPETEEPEAPPAPIIRGLAQLAPEDQEAWLKPFRSALSRIKDVADPALQGLVFMKTLGCMGRAFYTPANLGHFGLGSTCYAHFTSPIRRYPDLVVHRQLRWHLRGREGPMPHDVANLERLGEHTSMQGSAAEGLERGTVDAALVFASRGDRWSGAQRALVNGLTRGGVFMSLDGGLEARVATSDIPGGPWSVDDHDSMLFNSSGERPEMMEDVTATNWREMVDPESDEVRQVSLRLGDRVTLHIKARDYVEGKVAAKLGMPAAE